MTGVALRSFGGAVPGLHPEFLNDSQASYAENIRVVDGKLRPMRSDRSVTTLPKAGPIQSIYYYLGKHWLHWADPVNVVRGPIADGTEGRIYWTGEVEPRMSYASIATASVDEKWPSNWYALGVPAPTVAANGTVTGAADAGAPPANAYVYAYSFVSALGEEGPLGGVSARIDAQEGQSIDVSGWSTAPPSGNYNIDRKRLYRSTDGGAYLFVAEFAVSTGTWTDPLSAPGSAAVSIDWTPPSPKLKGLCVHASGALLGFYDKTVAASEPELPHAWPIAYERASDYPIVAVIPTSNGAVVSTTQKPYLLDGGHPSGFTLRELDQPYPCVSERGAVSMGFYAAYPSSDGVVVADMNKGARLATEGLVNPEQWRAINPQSIHAYRYGDAYIGFYDTGTAQGGFLLDRQGNEFTWLDFYASAGYLDARDGALYLVVNDEALVVFDDPAQPNRTALWRSKEWTFPRPVNMGFVQVEAEGWPVTVRVTGDGQQRAAVTLDGPGKMALPNGETYDRLQLEIETANAVKSVKIAETARELGQL